VFALAHRLVGICCAQAEKLLRRKLKNGAMKKPCNNPQQTAPEELYEGEGHRRPLSQHQASEVAERGRPQEALRRSEERYRRIVETTHEGIWIADLNGITTFVNPQMSRMLGSTPERMIGRPVFDFVFEEDRTLVRQHFAEFLQQPGGKRVEERLRRSDGTELWAVAAASVLLDAHSQLVSFLGMFTDITDHKRAEEGLRKSEARLQLQINRMPIAHILWNSQFRVLSWNPAAERMFGYTEQEALGKHPYDLIVSRAVQPEVDEIWRRLLQGDTTAHSVNANLTKEGRTIICQWSNTPIRESDGTVVGVLSMAQDITKRVRAEEALRDAQHRLEMRVQERTAELQASNQALAESGEKYRRLFETISDAAFVFEAASRKFVEVNGAALRLYGYNREEFLQLTHSAITAEPEDSEATIQLTLAGVAPRIPLRYHKKKDGTIFPVEISASTFTLTGRPMVCGIIRDITARKQADEALRRREQELADFFAESPLGLLWVGPDGRILRVNQAELELLGRTGDEVFGQHVSELHMDAKAAADLLSRLARKQTVQNQRARLRHKDGTQREVLIDANGLWEQERLVYSRWFTRDITRRVELEREILAISEREQRRLGHDLHDDLCQQLAGIEFLTQRLASDTATRAAVRARAKEIAQMVQRAMTQTRELARGLSPVRLEAEGLTDALRELAMGTRKVFGCDCRFRCDPPVLVPDHTVAFHLYRIAQEAASNAIKHGKAQRIDIGLTALGRSVTLAVKDNGTGIPSKLPRRKSMGLRIMRYRAEAIGGVLVVEPGPGGGTRVVCTVAEGLLPPETRNAK
jgi:two-component system, LuxR family, sensor kinase FixL